MVCWQRFKPCPDYGGAVACISGWAKKFGNKFQASSVIPDSLAVPGVDFFEDTPQFGHRHSDSLGCIYSAKKLLLALRTKGSKHLNKVFEDRRRHHGQVLPPALQAPLPPVHRPAIYFSALCPSDYIERLARCAQKQNLPLLNLMLR